MDYLEAASLLGQSLLESEIFVEFKKAENALMKDEKAQQLLLDYRQMQEEVVKLASDDMDKEALEKARTLLLEKNSELSAYEITKKYFECKKDFDQMMQEVNSVLEHYLTGESSDCTGSCDTCGGCH